MIRKIQQEIDYVHDHNIIISSREIFLGGKDEGYVDANLAMSFLKNIRLLDSQNNKTIFVHQHGIGGVVEDGLMIFDAVRNATSPIVFILWGPACSISSLIPLAADVVVSMPSNYIMLHAGNSSITPEHTMKQSKEWHQYDLKIIDYMTTIYAEACLKGTHFKNKSLEQIKKYIRNRMNEREDWIISPEEAVKYGFVNGIFGQPGYEDLNTIRGIYDKQ